MTRRKSLLDPVDSKWDREVSYSAGTPRKEHTYTHFNRDDLRRLKQSNRMLERLLEQARIDDLPAMSSWLVTPFSVVGEISPPFGGVDPAGCRKAFLAWTDALYLVHRKPGDPVNEGGWWRESRLDGKVELRGATELPAPAATHLRVTVQVIATWWEYDETSGGES